MLVVMPQIFNSYRLLAHLPLFQGMSASELDHVIEKMRLDFSKVEAGKVIVAEGERVDKLRFIIRGDVCAETMADDKGYSIKETLNVPCMLQIERLFGLSQYYSTTFYAESECQILSISKADLVELATMSEVFRLNMMNILCAMTQKSQRQPWHTQPSGIRQKIFMFIKDRTLRPAGRKEVNIGMVRLGKEIAESRLNVSKELRLLQAEGLIEMKKNKIIIPALEKILC